MKYSTEQSEITERTERVKQFALLVDKYNRNDIDKEKIISELAKIEKTDWTKENLFNQLLGYSVLGDAYSALKRRNLDYAKAYYTNE